MNIITKAKNALYNALKNDIDVTIEEKLRAEIDRRIEAILSDHGYSQKPATKQIKLFKNAIDRDRKIFRLVQSESYSSVVRKGLKTIEGSSYMNVRDAFVGTPIMVKTNNNMTIVRSPYKYSDIDRYYSIESYFSRSVGRQVETTLRNGFYFVSEEEVYGRFVRAVMSEYQRSSVIPLLSLISRILTDLLKYGFFVVKKEWQKTSYGKSIKRLVPLDIPYVSFVVDDSLSIRYVYVENLTNGVRNIPLSGLAKQDQIPVSDCIIGFFTDPGTKIYPEPPCIQIIDDILTLRSLEETVELLAFQYGSPLLHAKVGTPEAPCRRGETQMIVDEIAAMAPNGIIATDHRVVIESVRLQSGISNMIPYIEHFKDRIFIGSGTSGVIVGEGDTANRATSESHDNSLADRCSYMASIVENAITFQLICDILSNAGKPTVDDEGDPIVTFEFNEMTLSRMIEKSNNAINLYQSNLITTSEARKVLKRRPLSKQDSEDTYLARVQIPLALVKSKPEDFATFNPTLQQPVNQYGKKLSPGSRKD